MPGEAHRSLVPSLCKREDEALERRRCFSSSFYSVPFKGFGRCLASPLTTFRRRWRPSAKALRWVYSMRLRRSPLQGALLPEVRWQRDSAIPVQACSLPVERRWRCFEYLASVAAVQQGNVGHRIVRKVSERLLRCPRTCLLYTSTPTFPF